MELVLEQTQQGTSYEVSISAEGVEKIKRKVKIKGEKKEALLTFSQKSEHQSDTQLITVKMEILLEPTSNKLLVDSILQAGNPVKEILLKLNLPDHRILKDGGKGILAVSKIHNHMLILDRQKLRHHERLSTCFKTFATLIPYVFLEVMKY
ncbi:hypothetical protein Tco_0320288 [Tanacetum coccineum]